LTYSRPYQDVAAAHVVYERAAAADDGVSFDLLGQG